jgi:hypothetical protein
MTFRAYDTHFHPLLWNERKALSIPNKPDVSIITTVNVMSIWPEKYSCPHAAGVTDLLKPAYSDLMVLKGVLTERAEIPEEMGEIWVG